MEELEHEGGVEVLEIGGHAGGREVDLPDEERVARGLAQGPDGRPDVRRVDRVQVLQAGVVLLQREGERLVGGRIVAQVRVLEQPVYRVDPETIDTSVEPEAHDVLHRRHDLGVAPVEVGLLGIEGVQVPAPGLLVARPGRPAERGDPVVRRLVAVGPDVPVRVLAEPGVLDRGVIRHQVHEQLQPPLVRGGEEGIEIRQGPVGGIHGAEVRDVVAEVGQRTRVDRRQPEGVDAQRGDVIQAGRDAPQVADAVAVGVLKGARIDLVDDGHWSVIGFRTAGPGRRGAVECSMKSSIYARRAS